MTDHFTAFQSLLRKIRLWDPGSRLLAVYIALFLISSGCSGCSLFSSRKDLAIEKDPVPLMHQVIIADNTIYQNNAAGLQIRGNTPVNINNCNIYQNGRAGINIEHSAKVDIKGCKIFLNRNSGIGANNASKIHLQDSMVYQNQNGGIRVRRDETFQQDTYVSLQQNKIFLNGQGGVLSIANSPIPIQLFVSKNAIYRNQQTGIRIENNVHMTAARNEVYRNGTSGIAAFVSTDLRPMFDVYENRIYFNRGAGIFILNGATGDIGLSNNWVFNNYRSGIACGLLDGTGDEQVDIEIFHNTIVGNGSGEEGAGIRNDCRGDVIIKNNIIAYNFVTGIMTRGCGGTSYNLLFANGETSSTTTSNNHSFLIEKVQYAGCSGMQWGDVFAAPLFLNPDQYDFSLQENSPARNAAGTIHSPYFHAFPIHDLGAAPFTSTAR